MRCLPSSSTSLSSKTRFGCFSLLSLRSLRAPGPFEVEDFEGLPGGHLRVQPLQDAIALLNAGVGRLGEPLVHRCTFSYAEYAGVR